MARSKRVETEDKKKYYCRKCMDFKTDTHFYKATDFFLDSNGFMSICKDCIGIIYDSYFEIEHTIEKTLLMICRTLNIAYREDAVEATKNHIDTLIEQGKPVNSIFGLYKSKLVATQKSRITNRNVNENWTFVEPSKNVVYDPIDDTDVENSLDLKYFWGTNFNYDDYVFLEKELAEWKKTHKCATKAEESLLKELCYKELEIRNARIKGQNTGNLVTEKQALMKTASVDPSKASAAGSGRNQDTFSSFIKIIEQNEPADYYKDKALFKDFDNIDWYFRKYVTTPLKNFITQSRDFNIARDDNEDDEDSIDDIIGENN